MRFLAVLGQITPEGVRAALQQVIAIITILVAILRFIEHITREGVE